ncbi:MAG: hypothetical protein K9M45_13905 [Kiritimatiellales bacterium]|nr:hypothetical protein [Kiritimatiellales bacterium]
MQYIGLELFEDFVRSRNLVDDQHLPYYINWILRFLRSEFDREHLSENDLLQCYSDQLARDDSVQDWQLRQNENGPMIFRILCFALLFLV